MTNKYMEMKESERYCSFCNYNNNNNKAHAHSFVSKCLWLAEKKTTTIHMLFAHLREIEMRREEKKTLAEWLCVHLPI